MLVAALHAATVLATWCCCLVLAGLGARAALATGGIRGWGRRRTGLCFCIAAVGASTFRAADPAKFVFSARDPANSAERQFPGITDITKGRTSDGFV